MPESMMLTDRVDAAGKIVPNCRVTEDGYTISETGRPAPLLYAVTRPGDALPFSYVPGEIDILAVIRADIEAGEVTHADT